MAETRAAARGRTDVRVADPDADAATAATPPPDRRTLSVDGEVDRRALTSDRHATERSVPGNSRTRKAASSFLGRFGPKTLATRIGA